MKLLAAALLSALSAIPAPAQYAAANREWNRPVEPFRVAGNIYYVGASGVSSYLITTPEGHFLLDSGFRETAPMVEASIKKLGFRVGDIRFLLTSHGHYDHVGGVAQLKLHSKAMLLASPTEVALFQRGGKGDFAFGDKYAYPPVTPDRLLHDGEEVRLGATVMTAHFTPGHTRGCTTWTTTVQEGAKLLHVVFPCSVSAPGYQLVNNPKYRGIQRDFEATFTKLRALPCDIFLGLHSWEFDLLGKIKANETDPTHNAFIDAAGYLPHLDQAQAAIREAVAKQARH